MNAKSAAIAVVVLCATVHAQTPAADRGPLDSAKRELQTLPQEQGAEKVFSRSRPGLGSAGLPSLTDPLSANLSPSGPAQSPTWLQDTIDAVRSPRDLSKLEQAKETLPKSEDKASAAAYDPFDRYIAQWLSPRDLEILRPGSKTGPGTPAPSFTEIPGRTPDVNASTVDTFTPAFRPIPASSAAAPARNPYLESFDNPAPVTRRADFQGDVSSASSSSIPAVPNRGRAAPSLAPAATPPPAATLSSKPATPRQETVIPPPTAPVVDDRKYFPQLRRF